MIDLLPAVKAEDCTGAPSRQPDVLSNLETQTQAYPGRVSVLMAVFNTAPYLREALESISRQSYRDFELLVVDDGSDDGSAELLRSYQATEPRMVLVSRPNLGIIATRNELLAMARGELIAWMDSDDVSLPQRLAVQVSAFDADPTLVCVGGAAQCTDPNGNALNVERYPAEHADILVAQQKNGGMRFPTTMMKRAVALSAGGFREPFKIGEDFDLLLRISEAGKMSNLPEIIYLYRQHLASACSVLGRRWAAYRETILQLAWERREHGSDRLQNGLTVTVDAVDGPGLKSRASEAYAYWARCALNNGNRLLAWRYSLAALITGPGSLSAWRTAVRVVISNTA